MHLSPLREKLKPNDRFPNEKPSIKLDQWDMIKASQLGQLPLVWIWHNVSQFSHSEIHELLHSYQEVKILFDKVKRSTWEPYAYHPLAVCIILLVEFKIKCIDTARAALGHDSPEDKPEVRGLVNHPDIHQFKDNIPQITDFAMQETRFWNKSAKIIRSLTKPWYSMPKSEMSIEQHLDFNHSYYINVLNTYPDVMLESAQGKSWDIIHNNRTEQWEEKSEDKASMKVIERYRYWLPMAKIAWDKFYETLREELSQHLHFVLPKQRGLLVEQKLTKD